MPIRKHEITDEAKAMFAPRKYSDVELRDFHNKIQQFWEIPRTLADGQIAQKFNYEELAVAYGAARKDREHYLYKPERYAQLNNLLNQYEDWKKKQDWIENKKTEELESMAEEVIF